MSATCLCRSVVVSVNIFCLSVFVCELTFGQLSVGELSHNDSKYKPGRAISACEPHKILNNLTQKSTKLIGQSLSK